MSQKGGYAVSLTTGSTANRDQVWGNLSGGPGAFIRAEPVIGSLEQTLVDRNFGINGSDVVYSAESTDTVSGATNLVAQNDLTLEAIALPLGAFGFFLASTTQDFVPNPGGSTGNLCLGGEIGRYLGPGQIQSTGTTGAMSLTIDLTAMPQPTGAVAVQSGETWNFQAWHRDMGVGTAAPNLSNGCSIVFQ